MRMRKRTSLTKILMRLPAQGVKEPEHDDMEQTTRIDFGELQFGRDYEIK